MLLAAFVRDPRTDDVWATMRGWNDTNVSSPCSTGWEGVICSAGRVTHVDLTSNSQLGFELSPALGELDALSYLDTTGTRLSGTLPPQLSLLTSMQKFGLGRTHLSGTIPEFLSELAKLDLLELSSPSARTVPAVPSSERTRERSNLLFRATARRKLQARSSRLLLA